MKHKLLFTQLLIFSSFSSIVNAQAPDWLWAKSAGGVSLDLVEDIATDSEGGVIITGYFNSPTLTFGNITLVNAGDKNTNDIFIVKYDAFGNVVWAKSAGGPAREHYPSISTDQAGYIYLAGITSGPSMSFGKTSLVNDGDYLSFIAKYDAFGKFLWVKPGGNGQTSDFDHPIISNDANGNIFVTGYFTGNSITFGTITLRKKHFSDIFVVKYDTSGNVLWARSAGGNQDDYAKAISTDQYGNVLITGHFGNDSITFGNIGLANKDGNDVFVVKYDASGTVLWARSSEGNSFASGSSITSDGDGNVIVSGDFGSPSLTFGTTTLTNEYATNIFVAKYDALGNFLWAQSGNAKATTRGISTDARGNILVTGRFFSPSITFGKYTLVKSGEFDNSNIFIVKYDATGNVIWAKSAGENGINSGQAIATDRNGNVFLVGYFMTNNIEFGNTSLRNMGGVDVFVAKLGLGPLGIAEDQTTNQTSIFPNPFNTSTTIELRTAINNGQLNLYNAHGQLVKEMKNLSGRIITFFRDNLPAGLYFSNVLEGDKEILANKLIIND